MKTLAKFLCLASLLLSSVLAYGQGLSTTEMQDLLYSREEEKFARDVYRFLYSQWNLPIFNNIATSEQRHMDAVLVLLNQYGIADPVGSNADGIFVNSALQALYDQLTAQGTASTIAALEVGVSIEELDITDIETAIAQTDEAAIIRVYNNLLKGSNNHLAAFINNLESLGGSYSGGNQAGSSTSPGTAVFEPISQTLYVPAVDIDFGNGEIVVHDALFRLLETLPQTLQAVTATPTPSRQPNPDVHASFSMETGVLTIKDLVVGSLVVEDLNNTHYTMVLQMDLSDFEAALFSVTSLTAK